MRLVSLEYLTTAKWIFRNEVVLNANPSDVFTILLDDDAWNLWHPEISEIDWQTEAPHTVGSKRSVRFSNWLFMILLFGSLIIHEEFLVWETNKRLAFRFNRTNRPRFVGYLAGMEDFQIEELEDGKCKLIRTVAVDPSFITSMLACILKPVLRSIFNRSSELLAKKFESNEFPLKNIV